MAVTVTQSSAGGFKVNGLDSLLRKLEQNRLYAKYWRAGLGDIADGLKERAQSTAPVASGRLKKGMVTKIDKRVVPLWALVTNNVTNRSGARYPWVLNAGRVKGRTVYHYRSGRLKGRPTKNWFSWVLPAHLKRIEQALNKVADAIEAAFGSRLAA